MRAQTRILSVATTLAWFATASPAFAQLYVGGGSPTVEVDLAALDTLPQTGPVKARIVKLKHPKDLRLENHDVIQYDAEIETTVIGGGGEALAPLSDVKPLRRTSKKARSRARAPKSSTPAMVMNEPAQAAPAPAAPVSAVAPIAAATKRRHAKAMAKAASPEITGNGLSALVTGSQALRDHKPPGEMSADDLNYLQRACALEPRPPGSPLGSGTGSTALYVAPAPLPMPEVTPPETIELDRAILPPVPVKPQPVPPAPAMVAPRQPPAPIVQPKTASGAEPVSLDNAEIAPPALPNRPAPVEMAEIAPQPVAAPPAPKPIPVKPAPQPAPPEEDNEDEAPAPSAIEQAPVVPAKPATPPQPMPPAPAPVTPPSNRTDIAPPPKSPTVQAQVTAPPVPAQGATPPQKPQADTMVMVLDNMVHVERVQPSMPAAVTPPPVVPVTRQPASMAQPVQMADTMPQVPPAPLPGPAMPVATRPTPPPASVEDLEDTLSSSTTTPTQPVAPPQPQPVAQPAIRNDVVSAPRVPVVQVQAAPPSPPPVQSLEPIIYKAPARSVAANANSATPVMVLDNAVHVETIPSSIPTRIAAPAPPPIQMADAGPPEPVTPPPVTKAKPALAAKPAPVPAPTVDAMPLDQAVQPETPQPASPSRAKPAGVVAIAPPAVASIPLDEAAPAASAPRTKPAPVVAATPVMAAPVVASMPLDQITQPYPVAPVAETSSSSTMQGRPKPVAPMPVVRSVSAKPANDYEGLVDVEDSQEIAPLPKPQSKPVAEVATAEPTSVTEVKSEPLDTPIVEKVADIEPAPVEQPKPEASVKVASIDSAPVAPPAKTAAIVQPVAKPTVQAATAPQDPSNPPETQGEAIIPAARSVQAGNTAMILDSAESVEAERPASPAPVAIPPTPKNKSMPVPVETSVQVAALDAPAPVPETAPQSSSIEQVAIKSPPANAKPISDDDLHVDYIAGTQTLPSDGSVRMDGLVARLQENADLRVELRSYASTGSGTSSMARRLSLSRALAARSYLTTHGIDPNRIDVRALGADPQQPATDRVDFFLVR